MLIIQCLLAAIALILVVGFWVVGSFLQAQHINQTRHNAAVIAAVQNAVGESERGEFVYAMRDIKRFLDMVEAGRYPNMRHDGWYPKAADLARWEHTEIISSADKA